MTNPNLKPLINHNKNIKTNHLTTNIKIMNLLKKFKNQKDMISKTTSTALFLLLLSSTTLASAVQLPSLNGQVISFNLTLDKHKPIYNIGPGRPDFSFPFNFFLGANIPIDSAGNTAPMIFDFNYRSIMIPTKAGGVRSDGIPCSPNTHGSINNCEYNPDSVLNSTVGQDHWSWWDDLPLGYFGNNTWNWTANAQEISNTVINKVGLLHGLPAGWAAGKYGLMGVGSGGSLSGSIWDYLFKTYAAKDDTLYATWYLTSPTNKNLSWYQVFNATDTNGNLTELFMGSQFRVSDNLNNILDDPMANSSIIWATSGMYNGSQSWGIPNATLWAMDNTSKPVAANTNICFDLNANATFLIPNASVTQFTQQANYGVCRGFKCGPGSFILNGGEYAINFTDSSGKNTSLTIEPQAYLFQNSSGYVIPSVTVLEQSQFTGCNVGTSGFGLGRMFFYNYQVILKMNKDRSIKQIGFVPYASRPVLSHFANVGTLVVIGLLFVFFLFICIMTMRWKGISESGDEDDELDNQVYHHAKEEAKED